MNAPLVEGLELYPVRLYGFRQIGFYGDIFDNRGKPTGTLKYITIEDEPREMFAPDPAPPFSLSEDATQKLFQNLWDIGFRPDKPQGDTGMLKATQDHLNDMRKIVSDKLKVIL